LRSSYESQSHSKLLTQQLEDKVHKRWDRRSEIYVGDFNYVYIRVFEFEFKKDTYNSPS